MVKDTTNYYSSMKICVRGTSLCLNFNYGYFNSVKFTFSRPSKGIENRHIAQWDSALRRYANCNVHYSMAYYILTRWHMKLGV